MLLGVLSDKNHDVRKAAAGVIGVMALFSKYHEAIHKAGGLAILLPLRSDQDEEMKHKFSRAVWLISSGHPSHMPAFRTVRPAPSMDRCVHRSSEQRSSASQKSYRCKAVL